MKLKFPEPEIPEDGFTNCDLLGRQPLAQSMLTVANIIEDDLVCLLDAPWGTGKTFFIRQFINFANTNNFPTIYFDAFKNDIVGDAFAALSGEILRKLEDEKTLSETAKQELIIKVGHVGKHLLKGATAAAIHYATAGLFNAKLFSELTSNKAISDALQKGSDEFVESGLSSISSALLSQQVEMQQSIEELRDALSKLASSFAETAKSDGKSNQYKRTIFVIDELDRCRPNFALDVLEVVKKIFDAPNIAFIVVADSSQLRRSIECCYGAGIESGKYLEKFFDLRFTFPKHDDRNLSAIKKYSDLVYENIPDKDEDPDYVRGTLEQLVSLAETHTLSLRSFQKICQHFTLVMTQSAKNHYRVTPVIATLCFCREIHPTIYNKLTSGICSYDELAEALKMNVASDDDGNLPWFQACLKWCLTEDLQSESHSVQSWNKSLFRFSLDRENIFPILAKNFVEPNTILKSE